MRCECDVGWECDVRCECDVGWECDMWQECDVGVMCRSECDPRRRSNAFLHLLLCDCDTELGVEQRLRSLLTI